MTREEVLKLALAIASANQRPNAEEWAETVTGHFFAPVETPAPIEPEVIPEA